MDSSSGCVVLYVRSDDWQRTGKLEVMGEATRLIGSLLALCCTSAAVESTDHASGTEPTKRRVMWHVTFI